MKGTCPSEVVIKDGIVSITDSAFYGCTGLTSVDIPDSVTSIGYRAFYKCTGLTSVTIPDSVTSIGGSAFYSCKGLTSVDIPDSVTSIGYEAFYGCTSLTSIDIPDSVTSIGENAFANTAWYNNQPDGLVYAGKVAYKMKGKCPSEVVIKDGALGIAEDAFYNCTELKSVDIPDSVTSIGGSAFSSCYGLKKVTIPDSVTSISYSAFSRCTGLTSIDIPDSVTSIGWYAFESCTSLRSVTIPDSVTSIGGYAFYDCKGLMSVTIPDSVTSIGSEAFGYYYDDDWNKLKFDGFTIYGYKGSEAERYAKDNEFTFVPLKSKPAGVTVSGAITSYIDNSDVTVKLTGVDNNFTAEVKGKSDYSIEAVPAGEYTLTVSKANHVTREYTVTVSDTNVTQDVKICPKGDVNADGKTNAQDCTAILRYVRKIDTELSDYQLKCADVTGDGKTNVQDVTRILRHVRKIEALYTVA